VHGRLSVWHFLVVIALLPTLGLPMLAGTIARERLDQASTASRLERDLLAVASMDRLREALTNEASAAPLGILAQQANLPLSTLGALLGTPIATVAEARIATDHAFGAVPRLATFDPVLAHITTQLATVRAAFDAAPSGAMAGLTSYADGYGSLLDLASIAEQTLAHRIGNGMEGMGSAGLLARIRSFDAVGVVVASQGRRANLLFSSVLADPAAGTARDELAAESKRYDVLSERLDTELDPQTAAAWDRLSSDEQFQTFDDAVADGAAKVPGVREMLDAGRFDLSTIAAVFPAARAAIMVVNRLSAFLQQTAQDIAALARAAAAGSRRYALMSLGGAGLTIGITIAALFVVGGVLRGRLRRLAEAAQRLSAGPLEPTLMRGPRELAAISEALNAAVASLRHVQVKADLLAAGELDSPELEQPAPGPLGAAVHASVSRIVTAAREREELQLRLAYEAAHDPLTGLPNRGELDRTLRVALEAARRDETPVSLMFIDLDGFKQCNDRYGHAAGDHVLRVSAQRLGNAVRPGDVVGRLGGDEFVVLADALPPGPTAVQIAERIVAALSLPIEYNGGTITIGASVGVAGCSGGQASADQLLSDADAAVYEAKAAGRGCVMVRFPSQRETAAIG
jgi:diguanylate cyclase (GGDEF)-like protein